MKRLSKCLRTLLALLPVAWLMAASQASAELVLTDPGDPLYYRITAAGHDLQIEKDTAVTGNLHANGSAQIKKDVVVDGDVTAVGSIHNQGTVNGTVTSGAEPVALPPIPGADELHALADRVFDDDVTFRDEVIDDVVFVDGTVRVEGTLEGEGTILATGEVRLREDTTPPGNGTRISIISLGDIRIDKERPFRGVLRAGGDINLEMGVVFEGVAIADGKVHIKKDGQLTFLTLDEEPPMITLISPPDGSVLDASPSELVAGWSDDFSGVDPATASILLDGVDRTAEAVVNETGLTLTLSEPLDGGAHSVEIAVSDVAGNTGQGTFGFEIQSGPVDRVPPTLTLTAPEAVVINEVTPVIEMLYSDDDSGIDPASLSVTIDGAPVTACTARLDGADCEAPQLSVGEHVLNVTIRDQAGNPATAELVFTIELVTVEQIVSFPVAADALLSEGAANQNFGDATALTLGAGSRDRLVLRLDLDAVREVVGSAVIREAKLSLTGSVAPSVQPADLGLSLHRLQTPWSEDGVTWTCPVDSAPADGDADCGAPWNGGAFDASPVATTVAAAADQAALFDFTTELQQALAGGAENGWIVKAGTEPWPFTISFGAKEATLVAERPSLLVLVEALPEPDAVDTTPPQLTLLDPANATHFNQLDMISFDYFDGGSGVDTGSVRAFLDGAALLCDVRSFGASCPSANLEPGSHAVEVEVADLVGNLARQTLTFELVVDLEGPVVTIFEPTPGQVVTGTGLVRVTGTAIDPQGVDEVQIGEASAPVVDGAFELFFDVTEGMGAADAEGELTLVADDRLENRTEVPILIVADSTPPALALVSPAPDVELNCGEILVRGTASDLNATPTVTVNGVAVSLDPEDGFSHLVQLVDGPNTIQVAAVDGVGNRNLIERVVTRFEVPEVRILSPDNQTVETGSTVMVTGETSANVVAVAVNDLPAALSGTSFSIQIPLKEGTNAITAVAQTATGRVGSDTISLLRDNTPPRLVIQEPVDGAKHRTATVDVIGLVLDPVGSADGVPGVRVTVEGQEATVEQGMFRARSLPLTLGENTLEVTGFDAYGNSITHPLTVVYEPIVGARLEVESGDHQAAAVTTELAQPLVVRAIDAVGALMAGVPVIWSVESGDGTFADGNRRALVPTGAAGTASIAFRLGSRSGVGNHRVRAESAGYGSVVFRVDGVAGEAADLLTDTGDQQIGATGQRLAQPFVVAAVDGNDNLLAGVPVTFQVALGDGHFGNGETERVEITDSLGRARVNLTLGDEPGVGNQLVWATFGGNTDGPIASFTASARTAGDPAQTTLVGQVLDNSDMPVPGVTLHLEGTSLSTTSDQNGLFELTGVPVGAFLLLADGTTATRPGIWPALEFAVHTIAGVENTLGRPIFMLPLDVDGGLQVSETTGGVLTLDDIPGFALEVAPGSVTFPDGSKTGVVSVTSVHYDKVPMAPEMAQQPRLVITIQPAGAVFDPPARLSLPNMEGLPPGAVAGLFSFDHDLGRFITIGPGMVSEDGLRIQSLEGVGVVKAGWHCCQHTAGSGTTHQCGYCRECVDDECVNASGPVPPDEDPQNCHDPACFLGAVIQFPTTAETPEQNPGNCFEEYCRSDGQVGIRADPSDTPPGGACCEMPSRVRPWPYDPAEQCCIALGLVDRDRSIQDLGLKLADCPDRQQNPALPPNHPAELGGCSNPIGSNPDNPHGDPRAPFGPAPESPCHEHDLCYRTCWQQRGAAREACDDQFCQDLRDACDGIPREEHEAYWRCRDNAWLYCVVVDGPGGIIPFRRNQRERCVCC